MAVTSALYAGAAAGITGTWANTGNATGSTAGTFSTASSTAANGQLIIEASSFGAQSVVPAGATVDSVTYRLRYSARSGNEFAGITGLYSSLNAQLYVEATSKASNSLLGGGYTAGAEAEFTVTGISYADLADLRVRLASQNSGAAGVSRTLGLDWASVVVDYIPPAPPPSAGSFFPFF